MKNGIGKKILTGFLSLLMFCGGMSQNAYVLAAGNGNKAGSEETEENKCIQNELPGYLAGFDYGTSADDIRISQKIEINTAEKNDNNRGVYFVFSKDKIIGAMSMDEVDGQKISSFTYGKFQEVEEAYENDEEIALADTGEELVMYSENKDETVAITGKDKGEVVDMDVEVKDEEDNSSKNNSSINFDNLKINSYNTSVEVNETVRFRTRKFVSNRKGDTDVSKYCFLKVPFVRNKRVNGGICWAASGASMLRYKKLQPKTLTAGKVYTALNNKYGYTKHDTIWIQRMWNYYNLGVYYIPHKISYKKVYSLLKEQKPIFCAFGRFNGNRQTAGHAVVLCGTYKSNNKTYYVYMDPNIASDENYVVNCIVPGTGKTDSGYTFYYSSIYTNDTGNQCDITYNNWLFTYY